MDSRVASLLEKAKVMAGKTGAYAGRAAESAGRAATDMAQATKLNLQLFDLNIDCDLLYKEIGKIVYRIHRGEDIASEDMDARLDQLDETIARADVLREQLAGIKAVGLCPQCGKPCERSDTFCAACGARLKTDGAISR